jgi:hypothetical protein
MMAGYAPSTTLMALNFWMPLKCRLGRGGQCFAEKFVARSCSYLLSDRKVPKPNARQSQPACSSLDLCG